MLAQALRVLAGLLLAYAAAVLLGSAIPFNIAVSRPNQGIRIYVADNGVHTDLVLPVAAAGVDWRGLVRAEDIADSRGAALPYLTFGWGDRDFYLNTPSWSEIDIGRVLAALGGLGATVLHVGHVPDPAGAPHVRAVMLRPEEYRRLAARVRATFDTGPDGHAASRHGYGRHDAFYAARGGYNLFNTCNEWTGRALRTAGVRMGAWTPLPASVMLWL